MSWKYRASSLLRTYVVRRRVWEKKQKERDLQTSAARVTLKKKTNETTTGSITSIYITRP
eukprot:2469983-Amphidinium_carterae.1